MFARVIRPLGGIGDAVDVVTRWPDEEPVLALVSADEDPRERWSVIASPPSDAERLQLDDAADVDAALGRIAPRSDAPPQELPFTGGWIGWLGYDLGVDFEPSACERRVVRATRRKRGWFVRCEAALLRDNRNGAWFAVGAREGEVDRLLGIFGRSVGGARTFRTGPLESAQGRARYERAVARTAEYVRAGDVFQANIAHELCAAFEGSPRAAFAAMARSARPAFGAYIEPPSAAQDRRIVCSISPELFLDADFTTRIVRTRPIKGTRGASPGRDAAAAEELRASEKDAAELAMIVDLMRNDLSRVCEVGSVRVDDPRSLERHGGGSVLHAVASVSGRMRKGTTFAGLLRATFPPGSVSGAPKVRAMQIIDELEPFNRGVYCGAIGFVSDSGAARLSVAIRTATIDPAQGRLVYPVGAGIVAQSDPALEWEETLVKARAVAAALSSSGDAVSTRA